MLQICISFVISYQLKKLIKLNCDFISYQVNLPISILLFFFIFIFCLLPPFIQLTSIKHVKSADCSKYLKMLYVYCSFHLVLDYLLFVQFTTLMHLTLHSTYLQCTTLHNIAQHLTTPNKCLINVKANVI